MPITCTFSIKGISPYSQSRPHITEYLPGESHDDYRERTWKQHLHVNKNGAVYIPPDAIKNCMSESAKFLSISIPGRLKSTYTKHVESGLACITPVELGIKAEDVQPETLFLPADGKRGSGRRVWKTYPTMFEWSGLVELLVLDETCLQSSRTTGNPVLKDIAEGAGQYIGLGRFRPKQNGWYGRFAVENFKVHRDT